MAVSESLFWLAYQGNGRRHVVIQPATSLVSARMKAALDGHEDNREFVEGYELKGNMAKRIPKDVLSRELSQAEAQNFLTLFEPP